MGAGQEAARRVGRDKGVEAAGGVGVFAGLEQVQRIFVVARFGRRVDRAGQRATAFEATQARVEVDVEVLLALGDGFHVVAQQLHLAAQARHFGLEAFDLVGEFELRT